jgi:hypothetical protein
MRLVRGAMLFSAAFGVACTVLLGIDKNYVVLDPDAAPPVADSQTEAGLDADAADAEPAEGSATCDGGSTLCGAECVDVASDDAHCGGCGMACPAAHACQTGRCVPMTCAAVLAVAPSSLDGVYTIDPDGRGPGAAFGAFCDMATDEGGWTLLIALAPTTVTNDFTSPSSWLDALPTDKLPPTISGLYKGSLAAFHEVREEIASGAVVVYGRNETTAALEVIRQQYGTASRISSAPIDSDIPPCRRSYQAATDSIVGCTVHTGPNDTSIIGWAHDPDPMHTGFCWFGRGSCCSHLGGSPPCNGSGDVDGTHWARTWFR